MHQVSQNWGLPYLFVLLKCKLIIYRLYTETCIWHFSFTALISHLFGVTEILPVRLDDCIKSLHHLDCKENMSLIMSAVQLMSRHFCSLVVIFIFQTQANHYRLAYCAYSKHIKQNEVHGEFRSTWMHHSFLYFSISHIPPSLAKLLYKFAMHPLVAPTSLSALTFLA